MTAQTGVRMEALLTRLEEAGYGLTAAPAPGDVTLGGVIAVAAHGTAVPAVGEVRTPGTTYGSLSNLLLSVTAVVWDADRGQYVLRTFLRSDPKSGVFLAHIGRAFLTEVSLQVGANYRLRWKRRLRPTTLPPCVLLCIRDARRRHFVAVKFSRRTL